MELTTPSGLSAIAPAVLAAAVLVAPTRGAARQASRWGTAVAARRASAWPGSGQARSVGAVARWCEQVPPWRGAGRTARSRDEQSDGALEALGLLAAALRAGLAPAAAVQLVGSTEAAMVPLLASLTERSVTLPPGPASLGGLDIVEQAWRLSELTGAPLADAVDTAAGVIRQDEHLHRATELALAGPRATMRLLSGLPLAGPAVAAIFGVSPAGLYAGSPLAVGSCALGLALLAVGRWWCARLIGAVESSAGATR